MYAEEDLGLELTNTIYAFDSSAIDLYLSVFPWALFRSTKSAAKLHTLLNIQGNIPSFIHISEGKIHDVNVLDFLILEAGAFYTMDRGYLDFLRLFNIDQAGTLFVIRAKSNKTFDFLTNNFTIPALTVANLYRYRWQVELFFNWIFARASEMA